MFIFQCGTAVVLAGDPDQGSKNPVTPPPPADDAWQFTLTPYGWAASLDGVLGVRGHPVDVDLPATDILDNLDMAAMLSFEARRGRWGGWIDFGYLQMSVGADPSGAIVDYLALTMEQMVAEATLFRRVAEGPHGYVDLYAGARCAYVSGEVFLDPAIPGQVSSEIAGSETWVDPIVGLRAGYRFSDRWYGVAKADIGGFGVNSDLQWQLYGALGYRLTKSGNTTLEMGYRHMMIDYENGDFAYDMDLGGPMLSFGVTF